MNGKKYYYCALGFRMLYVGGIELYNKYISHAIPYMCVVKLVYIFKQNSKLS